MNISNGNVFSATSAPARTAITVMLPVVFLIMVPIKIELGIYCSSSTHNLIFHSGKYADSTSVKFFNQFCQKGQYFYRYLCTSARYEGQYESCYQYRVGYFITIAPQFY